MTLFSSLELRVIFMLCYVCAQSCRTLCNPMDCSPAGSSVHGISPGKNTGVGCHFQLQGVFLTQGLNPRLLHLLHWQVDSLPLCHLVRPHLWVAAAAASLQLCPTLCNPIDGCPPGSAILGILQARTLEWVAISFSSA